MPTGPIGAEAITPMIIPLNIKSRMFISIGNAILYAHMNKCAVEDLKQRAKDANLAVGTYLVRELNLKQS